MWLLVIHPTGFSLGGTRDVYHGDVFHEPDVKGKVLTWLTKAWVREATQEEIDGAKKKQKAAAAKQAEADDKK